MGKFIATMFFMFTSVIVAAALAVSSPKAAPNSNGVGVIEDREPIVVQSEASPIIMEVSPVEIVSRRAPRPAAKITKTWSCGEWTPSLIGGTFRSCE